MYDDDDNDILRLPRQIIIFWI